MADDRNYKPRIAIWLVISIILAILFIGAGIAGLNSDRNVYLFYVQIGTTLFGILLSISETILAFYVVAKFAQDDEKEAHKRRTKEYRHPQTTLFKFTDFPRSIVFFFLGVLCLNTSVISLFWVLSGIVSYPTFEIRSYYHFLFVDLIIGYLVPILVLGGLALLLVTFQIISKYAFQPEGIFSSIIVFVDYKRYNEDKAKKEKRWSEKSIEGIEQVFTSDFGAWSIVDFFYYPIIEVPDDEEEVEMMYEHKEDYTRGKRFIDKRKLPSICFGLILMLNIILSLRVITNAVVIKELGGRSFSCSKLEEEDNTDEEYYCFTHSSRSYVNCNALSTGNDTFNMDCFRYYSPSEIDPLGALIRAIFLFITYEKFLQLLFGVVATLYKIRYHKAWGVAVLAIGIVMTIFSILCVIFYDRLETGFIFLSVFQFTILSLDISLAGALLVINCGYYKDKDGRLTLGKETIVEGQNDVGSPNEVFLPDVPTPQQNNNNEAISTV